MNIDYVLEKLAGFSSQSVEKAILNRISKIKALENAEAQKNLLLKTERQMANIADSIGTKIVKPYGLDNRESAEKMEKFLNNNSKAKKLLRDAEAEFLTGSTMTNNKPMNALGSMVLRNLVGRNKAQELKKAIKKELPLLELLIAYSGNNPAKTTALDELRSIHLKD